MSDRLNRTERRPILKYGIVLLAIHASSPRTVQFKKTAASDFVSNFSDSFSLAFSMPQHVAPTRINPQMILVYSIRIHYFFLPMRKSQLKHTLAILRQAIDPLMTQKEMSDLLGCSTATIQSIELGRLALSNQLAERIAFETGVDLAWLLNADVLVNPINKAGKPYTKQTFEEAQIEVKGPKADVDYIAYLNRCITEDWCLVASTLLGAYRSNKLPLAHYRISKAIADVTKEFNQDDDFKKIVGSLEPSPENDRDFYFSLKPLREITEVFETRLDHCFKDKLSKNPRLREKLDKTRAQMVSALKTVRTRKTRKPKEQTAKRIS